MAAARQERIPGTERPEQHKDIEDAALAYKDIRDQRMGLTEHEVSLRDALTAVMQLHNCKTYNFPDASPPLVIELTDGKVKAKVRLAGSKGRDDGDEE